MLRSTDLTSGSLINWVDLEAGIPARCPSRKVRQVVNDALANPAIPSVAAAPNER